AVVFRIYDPVAVGGGGSDQLRDNANVTMENDKWYQLAFTYDGKVLVGFVNGKKVLSKDYAGGLGPVANTPDPPPAGKGKNYNLSLGTWQQRDDWFKGAIDDFSYYKSVLTEAQIKQLYDAMLSEASAVKPESKLSNTWGDAKK
ncbi:LamG domain-containing protein, partial [Candidatus Poribacteria bacterium]|nr:LamG domain-containing protein [Candidatus Poribacteria bacterium]